MQQQSQFDIYNKAIFIGAMSPYIWRVSVGASIAVFGMNTDIVFLHDGLILGGIVLAASSFALACLELWHLYANTALRLDVIRKENGFKTNEKESEQKPNNASNASSAPAKIELTITEKSNEGYFTQKTLEFAEDEIPPRWFIEWAYLYAQKEEKHHIQERAKVSQEVIDRLSDSEREAYKPSASNRWLSSLERAGVLEKEDERPHSPRRWKPSVSLSNAIQAFGYDASDFSRSLTLTPPPLGVESQERTD